MSTPNPFRTLSGIALVVLAWAGALPPASLAAQESARQRAEQTLPADVYRELVELASVSEASGVPPEPLFNKALEGAAKRVPSERLLPAVRAYADRLGQARGALGPGAGIPLLVAGADALQRGVPADALRSLPADRPRSPVSLLVLAELMESGVPADRAIAMLRRAMDLRLQDDRMLDIPVRVRRLIRDGVPPAEAMDRVQRLLRRNRGGSLGSLLPAGDTPIADRNLLRDRLRDRLRPGG